MEGTWESLAHQLARQVDADDPRPDNLDPADAFADLVRDSLSGPVLRYSQRLSLIRQAERDGIGRFEANLIIAKVLHERGLTQETEISPHAPTRTAMFMTFLATQATILTTLWWLIWRH